jgi:rubrerythrin
MTPPQPTKLELICSACGYGVIRHTAPTRCPMCHTRASWIEARRRTALARHPTA